MINISNKLAIMALLMYPFYCLSENRVLEISDQEIWDYWELDVAKMSKVYPDSPDLDLYGPIQFKYKFLIDIDGRPKNFKFISAVPKSAEVEKFKLKNVILFQRYKRKLSSSFVGATLVNANEKWWKPDQNKITF